ncbi:Protein NEDD1 [Pitangus sulphuratus]|nr:Protein NEDD1 [Pitangus sulphuratus]
MNGLKPCGNVLETSAVLSAEGKAHVLSPCLRQFTVTRSKTWRINFTNQESVRSALALKTASVGTSSCTLFLAWFLMFCELRRKAKQTCVSLNSSSSYIVSGGLDSTVNIWDLKSRRIYRSLKDHKDEVTCIAYNCNDGYIASGSLSGEIILHNVTTNLSSTPFGYGSRQPIRHLKYSSFKKSLLGSVSDSGNVTLWDVNSQNPYHNFENTHKAPASEICFSPVNKLLLVTVGLDKRVILYDTLSKKLLTTIVTDFPLTTVDFMPDGTTLAIGCSRGKICQYDLRQLTSPVKTVTAHKGCVKCIRLQFSSTFSKSNLTGSSNKPGSKRVEVKAGSNLGGIQNTGIKNIASQTSATVSSHITLPNENKGGEILQEKTGFPQSCSLDVIPSKETDHGKSAELNSFDHLGRSSLGDVFSPVRDDIITNKGTEDPQGKGNGLDFQSYLAGLDFLPQLTAAFPVKRNPVGSSAQGVQSSPIHALVGSPIKEEEEEEDPETDTKKISLGKQETKEVLKQVSKPSSSNIESITLSPPPSSTPDTNERLMKNIQAHPAYELPVNGITSTSPKITSPVTAGVASSLSEKIVETIGSSRPNAPLTSMQINFIQNMIQETMDDFREACHRDIVNLQVEMIKQFHMQLDYYSTSGYTCCVETQYAYHYRGIDIGLEIPYYLLIIDSIFRKEGGETDLLMTEQLTWFTC